MVAAPVLVEEAGLEALVGGGEEVVGGEPGHGADEVQVEARPGHRRRGEQRLRLAPEPRHPGADGGGGALGEGHLAGLAEGPSHLLGVERAAVGDAVHLGGEGVGRRHAHEVVELLARGGEPQPLHPDAARQPLAVEAGEEPLHRRARADLVLAAGGDDHEPERPRLPGEEVEEAEARLVGAVHVLGGEVHRAPAADGRDRAPDPIEQAAAALLRRAGLAGQVPERIAARDGRDPGVVGESAREERAGGRAGRARQAGEDDGSALLGEARPFHREPRLAHAALAEEHERTRALLDQRLEEEHDRGAAAERGEVGRAEEAAGDPAPAALGGPGLPRADLPSLDGVAQRADLGTGRIPRLAQGERAGLVLPERVGAPAGLGEDADEEDLGLLARRADGGDAAQERERGLALAPLGGGAREREGRLGEGSAQGDAARREPGRVVAGREVAVVEAERPVDRGRVARGHGRLELVHVHPDAGSQRDGAGLQIHEAAAQDLAQVVEGAMQVVGATRRVLVGPEGVHHLVARQGVAAGEGEDLEHVGGPAAAPGAGRDGRLAPLHLEAAEQADPDRERVSLERSASRGVGVHGSPDPTGNRAGAA